MRSVALLVLLAVAAVHATTDVTVTGNLYVQGIAYFGYGTVHEANNEYQVWIKENAYIGGFYYDGVDCNDGCIEPTSDRRLKTNIHSLNQTSSILNKFAKVQTVTYNYVPGYSNCDECEHNGFIAQDLQKVFPDIVTVKPQAKWTDPNTHEAHKMDDVLQVQMSGFVPHLVSAVQALDVEAKDIRRTIASIRQKMSA